MFYKMECLQQLVVPQCKCFYRNECANSLNVFFLVKIGVDISKTVFIYPCCTFKCSLRLKFFFLTAYAITNMQFIFFH